MSTCKKNLTKAEIFTEFGKDEFMESCEGCQNIEYHGGIMTCRVLEEKEDNQ
jgi:hypothetical protein